MTSWHGNAFRITGPLWGEFIGHVKSSMQSSSVFVVVTLNKSLKKKTTELSAFWDAMALMWRRCDVSIHLKSLFLLNPENMIEEISGEKPWYVHSECVTVGRTPAGNWRNDNAIITSKRRRDIVSTWYWRCCQLGCTLVIWVYWKLTLRQLITCANCFLFSYFLYICHISMYVAPFTHFISIWYVRYKYDIVWADVKYFACLLLYSKCGMYFAGENTSHQYTFHQYIGNSISFYAWNVARILEISSAIIKYSPLGNIHQL